MKSSVLLVVLIFAVSMAAQKPDTAGYQIRAKDRDVIITFERKSHRFEIGGQIAAARVTETELLFAAEKDGFRYFLIGVSGSSRKEQNDRQCGAGVESNLIWLKIDAAWKVADIESVRFQSCWSGIEIDEPFEITKDSLKFSFDDIREKRHVRVFYDASAPEKGLQIVETAPDWISALTVLCNNLSRARI